MARRQRGVLPASEAEHRKTDAYKRSLAQDAPEAEVRDHARATTTGCSRPRAAGAPSAASRRGRTSACTSTTTTRPGASAGSLCFTCNNGLGQFQDDPELLIAAATSAAHRRLTTASGGSQLASSACGDGTSWRRWGRRRGGGRPRRCGSRPAHGLARARRPLRAAGREPDANGILLPEGFTSRVIARSDEAVEGTDYTWPIFPDGGAVFAAAEGGGLDLRRQQRESRRGRGRRERHRASTPTAT